MQTSIIELSLFISKISGGVKCCENAQKGRRWKTRKAGVSVGRSWKAVLMAPGHTSEGSDPKGCQKDLEQKRTWDSIGSKAGPIGAAPGPQGYDKASLVPTALSSNQPN